MSIGDRARAFVASLPARMRAGWPADPTPVTNAPLERRDVAIALMCLLLGAVATFVASGLLDRRLLESETMDVWFEADVPRTFEILTDRFSVNDRAKLHPLFALFLLPPVYALRAFLGVDPWVAVRVVYAVVAGVWVSAIFALFRLMGCRRVDAIVFTLVGATSAGAMFWFPIPETHTLASPTIVFAMIVVAVAAHRVVPMLVEIAVSASTLGVTVTNWMAGLLAPLVRRSLRQTVLISVGAFVLVVALWGVQKTIVPRSSFFIGKTVGASHILSPEARGVVHIGEAFLVHSVVMPQITVADRPGAGKWPVMLIQPADVGSAGGWSVAAAALWCALLGAGVWALVRLRDRARFRLYVAGLLAGQLVLFVLFGNETFLYAPNFLPVLLAIAAMAALTPVRRVAVAVAALLVVANTVNNVRQWGEASRYFATFAPFHHDFAAERKARPAGPWPQAKAGKPIAVAAAGTRFFDTGFATTGGGFNPGLDQFNVSFWVLNDSGEIVASSDNMSREDVPLVTQPGSDSSVVQLDASTPYYHATWRPDGERRYRLNLTISPGKRVALVVRGLGPPRAPVRQLAWDGTRLLVNGRWAVEPAPNEVDAYVMDERSPAWTRERTAARRISVIDGWAAARLELTGPGPYRFIVRDTDPGGPMDRVLATIPPSPATAEAWTQVSAGGRAP